MQWKKDPGMKYTDMCIFIDKHIPVIAQPGKDPKVENTVYNYLWLLVKALAIKKRMFQNFQDYDGYAFHAASRLFFALRNNYNNQGKTIKGKVIRPIKSCLNYTKALLYPMKVEYQNEHYNVIFDEKAFSEKFDAFALSEQLKAAARADQESTFLNELCLQQSLGLFKSSIQRILNKSAFRPQSVEFYRIKMSIMLTFVKSLKLTGSLTTSISSVSLWRLPKSLAGYVKVLYTEAILDFKKQLVQNFSIGAIDEDLLDRMIANPDGGFINHED